MSIFIEHKGSWWKHIDPDTNEKTGPEIRGSQLLYSTTTQVKKPRAKKVRKAA